MADLCCSAQYVAAGGFRKTRLAARLAVLMVLAGCGTVELFGRYDLPEGADVEAAPYPRLIDVPTAPQRGTYTAAVPDPAEGARTQADLSAAAAVAENVADDLSGPVISDAEKARLQAAARRRQP